MSERYAKTWSEYRKWRNRNLLSIFGFLPLMIVVGRVSRTVLSPTAAAVVLAVLVITWILATLFVGHVALTSLRSVGIAEACFLLPQAFIAGCRNTQTMRTAKVDLVVGRA
jgi:hypothetical protein